ncbi:MAG: hypothetical protein LPK08_11450 [Halomonas sp.]|nr:hypothetical protein [Halomonas sp.]
MLKLRVLFGLLAISLFANAYLFARSQAALPAPRPAAMLIAPADLGLTPDQALALESVRRFAEIRAARREEQRAVPEARLRHALTDATVSAAALDEALEEIGAIDAEYRYRLVGELIKWRDGLSPAQRTRLAAELEQRGLGALISQWR